MPGLMATRAEFGGVEAAQGRAHRRLAAHDHSDRGADRNPAGARRRHPLGSVQHLLDPGSCRRARIVATGTPIFAVKGASLKDYWDYQIKIFEWGDGGVPNMILDDGGDATVLIHLGLRAENS